MVLSALTVPEFGTLGALYGNPVPFGRRSRPWLREREGPAEWGVPIKLA